MRPSVISLTIFVVLMVATGCGDDADRSASPVPQDNVGFAEVPCAAPLPAGQSQANARCGWLTVPEDRARNDGRTVRLAVAVLKATGRDRKPDPLLFLNGGPGIATLTGAMRAFTADFAAPLQASRDLVFFDQRGTGLSEPSLDCPEQQSAYRASLSTSVASDSGYLPCRERLVQGGVNLDAYNSAASAADLADLMTALGYSEWNIYGWSYGSRLALTTMRDRPQGIRSVVLDATVPLQVNGDDEFDANFQRSTGALIANCRTDAACNQAFPDLQSALVNLRSRLNREPARFRISDPRSRTTVPVTMDNGWFNYVLFLALYDDRLVSLLPLTISRAAEGDISILQSLAEATLFDFDNSADGMHWSVQCNEDVPFSRSGGAARWRELCTKWDVGSPDPKENQRVSSDIPTLVLAGEYDPITPPRWGIVATESLSRSHFLQLRGAGHGVFFNLQAADGETPARHACIARLVADFFDRPANRSDESCVARLAPLGFVLR